VQALVEKPEARVVEGSNGLLLEVEGQIVPNYDATMQPFEEGEVVTGKVVRIDKDEVLVDIGYKSEGVIPSAELSIRKSVDPREEVELGEEVDAIVLTKEDQDGRLIMSKKRARFEKAWRRIEAAAESGLPVEGTVIEVVKGGLIIDLGVRGFLPASLVDIRRVPNLDEYMGTKIETKVIELNRSRNNVVLSRRAVLEEERKEVRQQILDRLQPGLVVEGQISNIVDFGAFVDLDGIDGLIHISELSWSHVNHPSEILNIGDTVQVKVLDIDRDRQRISLGLKQTQEDPWQRIVDTYNIGDELEGTVTKVVTFGAFVEILDGVEGLVHISELAAHHVESPREVVHPDDEIRVKILEIDSERRRLSLSAKRVEGQILPLPRAAGAPPLAEGELEAVAPEAGMVEALPQAGEPGAGAPEAGALAEVAAPVAIEEQPQVEVAAPAAVEEQPQVEVAAPAAVEEQPQVEAVAPAVAEEPQAEVAAPPIEEAEAAAPVELAPSPEPETADPEPDSAALPAAEAEPAEPAAAEAPTPDAASDSAPDPALASEPAED
jgi:small subunit ribosomal protein S1